MLGRLRDHGIVLKKSKCTFMGESVQYLGHRVDKRGIHATPDKVQALVEAPPSKNIHELHSLGLLNYCNKFIPKLASTEYIIKEQCHMGLVKGM